MQQNSDPSITLILPLLLLAAVLLSVPIIPNVIASSNSGPGGGNDDDDREDDRDDDRQVTAPQDSPVVTTTITIPLDAESHSAENPYSPKTAIVSSGSTVTWNNVDDEDTHSATADDGSFSTGIINPGASGQAVINAQPGTTVPYHCDVHPEMRGILQISAAAPESAPASNITASSAGPNSSSLQISDQPLAVGHYSIASENMANDTVQVSIVGNTTITLPNSTETITTNDTGNVTITFTESGGAILEGQLHLMTIGGRENATITVTEIFSSETAPGRGIASFSTDSTGALAPLDTIVAVTLDEEQPDGSVQVSFFEWHAGPLVDNNQANTTLNNSTSGNQTAAPTTPAPAANQSGGSTVEASIKSGSSSLTTDAYAPNPIEAAVGDTVTWTNRDSTPHTVTSGTAGAPDGNFDSSPGFNPLMPPQGTFSHTFEEEGEFPYYCGLHPNMVGTVIVASAGGNGGNGGNGTNGGPEPTPTPFSVTATDEDGNEYEITGSGNATATAATINPGESVEVEFDGAGSVELTLPKDMISNITTVMVGTETIEPEIVEENDTSTTISFEVPEGETSVQIMGGFVVPEFPVIAAILAVTIAGIIGYTRFAKSGTGFFGRA